MTPLELMQGRAAPLRLVIFDCDGVLVDSETLSNQVVADDLTALGWPMTGPEAEQRFIGLTLGDMVPLIERHLGRPLPPDWRKALVGRLVEAMQRGVGPVPGALEALAGITALGIPWRVASNSTPAEMDAKFARLGILDLVAGRAHSPRDVAHGKPAPDLYLFAAAAEGVPAVECLVVEDSGPGVRAAVAAGMDCLGYAPHSDGAALRALGAVPFRSMFDLPDLVGAALATRS